MPRPSYYSLMASASSPVEVAGCVGRMRGWRSSKQPVPPSTTLPSTSDAEALETGSQSPRLQDTETIEVSAGFALGSERESSAYMVASARKTVVVSKDIFW